jgi:hypothetical protein
MLKILNRILWFVQAVTVSIPPMDIPGFRKDSEPAGPKQRPRLGAAGRQRSQRR